MAERYLRGAAAAGRGGGEGALYEECGGPVGGGGWFTYRQHLYRIQHTLMCDLKRHWILQLRDQSDCVAAGDARVLRAM